VAKPPRHAPAAFFEAILFFAVSAAVLIGVLWQGDFQPTDRFYIRDWHKPAIYLEEILEKREITLITRNTTQSYFIYRDEPMGFEYDLAKAFADFIGVRLSVELADDWREMRSKLGETPTGFIAAGLPIPAYQNDQAAFSDGYMASRQHIVVHRDGAKIRQVADLAGRSVHVRKGGACHEALETLRDEGIDIEIIAETDVGTEELIRRVAEKIIDITIADSHVALLSRRYYPQIVVGEAISKDEAWLGWAVDLRAEGLLDQINIFFRTIQANGRFKGIYDRYYADVEDFDFVDLRAYHRRLRSRLPTYLPLIQGAAETYGFDWRLIAAQMYQESHFDPLATSHAGAYGLMQLTEETASLLGVTDMFDPEENIRAGVRHLRFLYNRFDEAEGMDRIYLALAAYDIGLGHLLDARRIARQRQLDPDRWAILSEILPLLSLPEYYKASTYGYCRGEEPVQYVKQTKLYYDILRYQERPWMTAEGEVKGEG
jgi:membrane-bound lytic murein transglycosylase F